MEEKKLHIASERMLKLIDHLISEGKVSTRQEFYDVIDFKKQHYRQIATLKLQNFTLDHIGKACKKWKVNVNWIFGFEKDMFREKKIPVKSIK